VGDQWYPVGKEGRIYVNRLPYGKYALMIRKRNGWGPGEYTVSSFSFEILPRWYNTRWFDILLFGFILLALLLFYLFRPRILMRQNQRLQDKVDLRTAELEQSTIIKERLISAIMHDLRSPLFAQGYLIGYMERNFSKMTGTEMGDLLVQLHESNKRICQFSTDFLTWYNTRLEGFQLELYPVELAPFVRQVAAFYLELAGRKGLSFTVDIPQGLSLRTDRNILAIVLRNLVDNAVKYTSTGKIHISSVVREGELLISVEDTGAGIPASKINELLNYGQVINHKSSSTYGYRLIIELTQLIKAGLNIESETGKGTTVALSFRT
jgi:signal transduction histidine kinase